MEKAAISVSSSSRYWAFPKREWYMIAPTVKASATSAVGSVSSTNSICISAGLMISKGRPEEAAKGKHNFSGFRGSEVKSRRHFERGFGGGGGASNYSFHKFILQPARCHKMFVPGFGEKSPEAKASDSLHNFFTFVAVKIVLSQLQDYNREGYEDLMDFVDRVSLKDGDKFCATLMRESFRHKKLALRIMEVRSAYSMTDFEWDNLQKLCNKHMEEANTRLMREFLVETSEYKE